MSIYQNINPVYVALLGFSLVIFILGVRALARHQIKKRLRSVVFVDK